MFAIPEFEEEKCVVFGRGGKGEETLICCQGGVVPEADGRCTHSLLLVRYELHVVAAGRLMKVEGFP